MPQSACLRSCKFTLTTFVGLFSTVCSQMHLQVAYVRWFKVALVTFVWFGVDVFHCCWIFWCFLQIFYISLNKPPFARIVAIWDKFDKLSLGLGQEKWKWKSDSDKIFCVLNSTSIFEILLPVLWNRVWLEMTFSKRRIFFTKTSPYLY